MGKVEEGNFMKDWIQKGLLNKAYELPFSFIYGKKSSRYILKDWKLSKNLKEIDTTRKLHTLTFKDSATGLEVIYEATEYSDFPALEWVIYFKNKGTIDTPILEKIEALDANFIRNSDGEFVLHHMRGCHDAKSDFAPLQDTLAPFFSKKLSCVGGRSSSGGDMTRKDGSFPFFNLTFDNGGIIFALGWTGQWAAEFKRDGAKALNVTAGMEFTHLKLLSGEEIRTPRILAFSWKGKQVDAHNNFRRFILKYHTPLKDAKPVTCPVAANTWFKHNQGMGTTEKNQIEAIDEFVEKRIGIEYFWIDAGWYEGQGNWWGKGIGNWFPKKKAFPHGLKPVAEHAKKNGMGFVLWFEPERVRPGTWLFKEHPEWLFMPNNGVITKKYPSTFLKTHPWLHSNALLYLGNPEARHWLTDHISSLIKEIGIDIYRQDFNFDPLNCWRANDAPDRQGISEIHHMEGLYAFWDELLRRHPGLIIDNCASGGRRIDLETISRCVCLHRDDYASDPEGSQSHTLGLNRYIPCNATGSKSTDPYIFRSCLSNGIACSWYLERKDFNLKEAQKRIKEFKMLRPLFYGDFYPLTAHNIASDIWCTYQLDRKDLNFGAVLAFRRKDSPYTIARFKLHNLQAEKKYQFTDVDSGIKKKFNGKELMEAGIEIKMPTAPGSVLMTYNLIGNL